jgi:WXG100 family type VII secretion target
VSPLNDQLSTIHYFMSNEYVQSNYEELDHVAQRFARQAELTAQMLQRLKQQSEALRNSWEGKAADAFSREMGTVLLPGVKRLHQAQVQARTTIQAIKQTMENAENEAAGLFRATPTGGGMGDGGMDAGAGTSNPGLMNASMTGGMGGGGMSNVVNAFMSTPAGGGSGAESFPASMGGGGLDNGGDSPSTDSSGSGGGGGGSDSATPTAEAGSTEGTTTGADAGGDTAATEPEATITFGANANQAIVSDHTRGVLNDILQTSNNDSATITSTARTVEDQARIMYGNIERQGVAEQKRLYGVNGDKVIDAYVAAKAEGLGEMEIRARMVEKINELGPTNVSKHLADPAVLNVIDVSPNSIANREEFEAAVRADPRVSKFLTPSDGDPAYHIEIPQPQNDSEE